MSKGVTRLYGQFVPENYKLDIKIDEEQMTFEGQVTILGRKVGRPSKRLTFHQKKLKFDNVSVTAIDKKDNETNIEVARLNTHDSFDELRIHSSQMIYPGKYMITMSFSGKITDEMHGLYPCRYTQDGVDKIMFATQLESHHAREVFPCIDEPEAKATFDLTLTTNSGQDVLGNTSIETQKNSQGKTVTTFKQTPVMSVYLLAFAFGEFHNVESKTKNGVIVRSWAGRHQPLKTLTFANDEAVKILEFFEDYFETPFPLEKLDQIALPDFDAGAMENWGLMTFREAVLLTDPDNPSISGQQYCSDVVAHEISHQWFGDLVTMKWWDDLWLNESFASLVPYIALESIHPEWEFWEQFMNYDVLVSSNRDIYSDVQSVGIDVKHPDEIGAIFDPAIVYSKGSRLLKMLLDYIGEDAFRDGLKLYFKKHAYKNTVRSDLWAAMSETSGKDINQLMTPWLSQSGMPVVTVSSSQDKTKRKITQSRFILDKTDDTQIWPIPLLANNSLQEDILDENEREIAFPKGTLLNYQGSGHYLVKYDELDDFDFIQKFVAKSDSSSESKINILNDQMLLSKRGDVSIVDSIKLVRGMGHEPRDAVWTMIARAIGTAYSFAEGEEELKKELKKIRLELASENYKKLGWDDIPNEPINTSLLRATTLSFMIGGDDKELIDKAIQIYHDSTDISEIPSDRRGLVLGPVVRHGADLEDVKKLIDIYKTTHDPDIQNSICGALTSTKSSEVSLLLISQGFQKGGFIRNQDIFRWFAYMMRNEHTRDDTWNWMVNSWDRILSDFGGGKSLDVFVRYAASPIQTSQWQTRFNDFFDSKKEIVSINRYIKIANAEIEARIKWRNRELPKLKEYLEN